MFDERTIINSNGQRYSVGWDEHGYFSIVRVRQHPETDDWIRERDAEVVSIAPREIESVAEVLTAGDIDDSVTTLEQARSKIVRLESEIEDLQNTNAGLRFILRKNGIEIPDKYKEDVPDL